MTPSLDISGETILFRCHSLASIMVEPKDRTAKISQGAKTAANKMMREQVFGVRGEINSRQIKKGLLCENESIALLSRVMGVPLTKNVERRKNAWLSGEPDLVLPDFGIDVKTSWSVDTFPLTVDDADDKTYEWQARGYMMLFDKPRWEIAYCLVDTPDELMGYESPEIHKVEQHPLLLRVTRVAYERDAVLEEKIKTRVDVARDYLLHELRKIELRSELRPDLMGTHTSVKRPPWKTDAASEFSSAAPTTD